MSDERNPIFEIREMTALVIESAERQAQLGIKEIVARYDLDADGADTACEAEVVAYLLKQVRQFGATIYMTDSVEGFIHGQVTRKLTEMATNPGSAILEAKWGN